MENQDNKKKLYRVVSFLEREELEFLDGVINDIYFKHGIKIPRAKLIEEIINSFQVKKDTYTREDFEKEFLRMFQESKEKNENKPSKDPEKNQKTE